MPADVSEFNGSSHFSGKDADMGCIGRDIGVRWEGIGYVVLGWAMRGVWRSDSGPIASRLPLRVKGVPYGDEMNMPGFRHAGNLA